MSSAACAVVVPVYDAHDATARCLAALDRHTPAGTVLVLVDDASPDRRIAPLLAAFAARRSGVRVLTRLENGGFVAAVNDGFAAVPGEDVIVLNSDTEVTHGWYEALLRCRDSDPAIGLACPLSNNATILTIEGIGRLLARGDGTPDAERIAECVARASRRGYPRLPTAVGFCMLVRRAVIDRCGNLDPVYARGYGEECDLSMRALDAGFEIACCDDAYVQHEGEASFGAVPAMDAQRAANRSRLVRRWPGYEPGVRAWYRANPLRPVIERVQAEAERMRFPGRPRVLQVLHRFGSVGGVEEQVRGIVNSLRDDAVFTLAWPQDAGGAWADLLVDRPAPHLRLVRVPRAAGRLRVMGLPAAVENIGVEAAFRQLLAGGFDVVHFHSLLGWDSLRLAPIAREAGCRVVFSAHDLSMLCADYNMVIGPASKPCGRATALASDAGCVTCLRGKSDFAPGLEPPPPVSAYLGARHDAMRESLEVADVLVAPSDYLAQRFRSAFGATVESKVRVVGHGVAEFAPLPWRQDARNLRVAFVGRFVERKGARVLAAAARRVAGRRISIDVHGPIEPGMEAEVRASGLRARGEFRLEDLPARLEGVDLVVVPTLAEEAFCLVVSEAQRLGIPVAASRIGAIPERVRHGETGFLVEPGNPEALALLLLELRDAPQRLDDVARNLRAAPPRGVTEAARDYLEVYRGLASRAVPAREAPPPDSAAIVRAAFGLPRSRRHSPLGTESWERWLASEPEPDAAAAEAVQVVILPGAGDAGATERALRAQADVSVTVLAPQADEARAVAHLNAALESATRSRVILLEAGDLPAPDALAAFDAAWRAHPECVLAFADEEAMSRGGERYDLLLKPAFDALLLDTHPYVTGMCALDRQRVLAAGGFRRAGWPGVVELALRLAAQGSARAIVHAKGACVRRLDLNLGSASPQLPARLPRAGAMTPVAVLVIAPGDSARALECARHFLRSPGCPIDTLFIEGTEPTARAFRAQLAGMEGTASVLAVHPSDPLGSALAVAKGRWLGVVDAACAPFAEGWLRQLVGTAGDAAAASADTIDGAGRRVVGWEVVGAGAWAIAGPPPDASRESANADLYGAPREVSALAPRLVLLDRAAVLRAVAPGELAFAGRYRIAHACLALRAAGARVVSCAFPAASLHGPAPLASGAAGAGVPSDVRWMRERWGAALASDPTYAEGLARSGPNLEPEAWYVPRRARSDTRPRIAAFPFDRWGVGEARVRVPCAALAGAGLADIAMLREHDTGLVPNRNEWARLEAQSILAHNFFHDPQLAFLADCAREVPGPVVIGMDDLLSDIPPGNPYAMSIYRDMAERIARAGSLCDRLVVSSEPLARAYGGLFRDVRVIPNALDPAAWSGLANKPRGRGRPRVGWAGARQHRDDLLLLAPVIEATRDEVDWIFLGMCPEELRSWVREVHPMVPIAQYPARLAALELDVAVAPLVDHPFNRAKSALKLLEYGVLGMPVVASDLEPYRDAPVTRVPAEAEAWIEALRGLVRERDRARGEGERLRHWVDVTGFIGRNRQLWYKALTDPK